MIGIVDFDPFEFIRDQLFAMHDIVYAEGRKYTAVSVPEATPGLPEGIMDPFSDFTVGVGMRSVIKVTHNNDSIWGIPDVAGNNLCLFGPLCKGRFQPGPDGSDLVHLFVAVFQAGRIHKGIIVSLKPDGLQMNIEDPDGI